MTKIKDGIQQIETDELLEINKKKGDDITLVDVREDDEYRAGHIPGVRLISLSEFQERYEQELDKDKEYIMVCRSGNRSQMACQFLKEQGYSKCHNYIDGMISWTGPVNSE